MQDRQLIKKKKANGRIVQYFARTVTMLQEDHSSNISTLFNSLPEHEDLFFGTITVECVLHTRYTFCYFDISFSLGRSDDNDVERDGGGASWLSKLVPRVFKRTRSMNVIEQVQPKTDNTVDVTVKQFTRDNTLVSILIITIDYKVL